MRRAAVGATTLTLCALVPACAPQGHDPRALADRITRAVYADDLGATTAAFNDATKQTITRSELGALSDRMHALGAYTSLTQSAALPDSGKYMYDARFTGGALRVELRIDPTGKVAAYRVLPEGGAHGEPRP